MKNASKNDMCAPFSMSGRHSGMSMAVMKFDRNVYAVICSMSPPIFLTTTAAADAHGPMTHISIASMSTRLSPVMPNPTTRAVISTTVSNWNALTQRCHGTMRSFLKSTLQKVTKSTRNMNTGSMASRTGAKKAEAALREGVKANVR